MTLRCAERSLPVVANKNLVGEIVRLASAARLASQMNTLWHNASQDNTIK